MRHRPTKSITGLVFILTFDEDDSHGEIDNRVYTVISRDGVNTDVNTDVDDPSCRRRLR